MQHPWLCPCGLFYCTYVQYNRRHGVLTWTQGESQKVHTIPVECTLHLVSMQNVYFYKKSSLRDHGKIAAFYIMTSVWHFTDGIWDKKVQYSKFRMFNIWVLACIFNHFTCAEWQCVNSICVIFLGCVISFSDSDSNLVLILNKMHCNFFFNQYRSDLHLQEVHNCVNDLVLGNEVMFNCLDCSVSSYRWLSARET